MLKSVHNLKFKNSQCFFHNPIIKLFLSELVSDLSRLKSGIEKYQFPSNNFKKSNKSKICKLTEACPGFFLSGADSFFRGAEILQNFCPPKNILALGHNRPGNYIFL